MARDRKRAKQRQRQRAGREPAPAKPDSGRGEPAEGGVEVEGLPAADEPVSVGEELPASELARIAVGDEELPPEHEEDPGAPDEEQFAPAGRADGRGGEGGGG